MAFDQSTITDIRPPALTPDLTGVLLQWTSSAANGTPFQIYVGRRLTWSGTSRRAVIPVPSAKSRIDIGTVAVGEERTDFSGSLPAAVADRAYLTWLGGTYLDSSGNDDVVGFNIYSGTVAGGAVNYASRIARIPAYGAGGIEDGWGLGGWGQGGWGRSASSYEHTTGPLANGTWNFGIKAFDVAGNEGTASTTSVVISAPPTAPARYTTGERLRQSWNSTTHKTTLSWNAAT